MPNNPMILNLFFFNPQGDYRFSWRHPQAPEKEIFSLKYYADLARSVGLEPLEMLGAVGLPRSCLDTTELRIPAASVMRLMELSGKLSGEQAFGLRLSVTRRLSSFGVVGMLARDEPTLRQVMDTLTRYLYLHNESLTTHIHESGGVTVIEQVFLPSVSAGEVAEGVTTTTPSLL